MRSILACLASRDDGQLGACLYWLPFLRVELPYDARLGALELVLHLHRLDDDEALPFGDGIAFLDQYPDDLSRHGRVDPLRAFERELPARLVQAMLAIVEQLEGVDLVPEQHPEPALGVALDVAAGAAAFGEKGERSRPQMDRVHLPDPGRPLGRFHRARVDGDA